MILHLKSPNVICINQQSDLLMYSSSQKRGGGGLFQRHIVSHIKMKGTPSTMTSTQLNVPKSGCFLQPFILCSKMEQGELMRCFKDFLFCYVRYYLSLVTRKAVFGFFGQLRFNLVCSATDVSQKSEISDIEIRYIILPRQGTLKTLIRLQVYRLICVFAVRIYKSRFSHDVAQFPA